MITLKTHLSSEDIKYIKIYGEGCILRNTHMIIDTETLSHVGFIEYVKSDDATIYVYYIYVSNLNRERKIGTEVVKLIKGENIIIGTSLNNAQAIGFWSSLDAEFDENPDDVPRDYTIPFTIY